MLKPILVICAALICLSAGARSHAAETARRVVIYDGVATEIAAPAVALPVSAEGDLWVTLADLKRATRFVVKPQGICRDELCFPIPKNRKESFLNKQGRVTWFNLSEFARLVRQPVAFDAEQRAWYFGARAEEQNAYLDSLDAPDFKLPDSSGKMRSLSEFRGKKVLLITWASW